MSIKDRYRRNRYVYKHDRFTAATNALPVEVFIFPPIVIGLILGWFL